MARKKSRLKQPRRREVLSGGLDLLPRARMRVANLRVRLPESLRFHIEVAADQNKRSMNQEIISRLGQSFHELGTPTVIAEGLFNSLDDVVLNELATMILRRRERKDEQEDKK